MFDWPLWLHVTVFAMAALLILAAGTKLTRVADRLADRTQLGEALTGAILLGAVTSLPGITASITAAWSGFPRLAISNALGGIAAQTAFLAIADFAHRRANLEHAAASLSNVIAGVLLIGLLSGVLLTSFGPNVHILGVHPMTPLLGLGYLVGLKIIRDVRDRPLWVPQQTHETVRDEPVALDPQKESLAGLWWRFVGLGLVVALCGWAVAQTGAGIASQAGIKETVVGGVFTAVVTSTPELITTVAAVRLGALTLAVGGVLGGNAFDVMFAVAADVAYRPGSVYHAVGEQEMFLTALAVVMTVVLVLGMLVRERRGIANIGSESALLLVLYIGGLLVLIGE